MGSHFLSKIASPCLCKHNRHRIVCSHTRSQNVLLKPASQIIGLASLANPSTRLNAFALPCLASIATIRDASVTFVTWRVILTLARLASDSHRQHGVYGVGERRLETPSPTGACCYMHPGRMVCIGFSASACYHSRENLVRGRIGNLIIRRDLGRNLVGCLPGICTVSSRLGTEPPS